VARDPQPLIELRFDAQCGELRAAARIAKNRASTLCGSESHHAVIGAIYLAV